MSATQNFHLLVVDDDRLIIDSLKLLLPAHWRLTSTQNPRLLEGKMPFHAAFVDQHLSPSPRAEGPEIISYLLEQNPKIEVVAMSGDLSLQLMEECLAAGAKKFLAKPLMADEALATLDKIEALWQLRWMETRGQTHNVQLVGKSKQINQVRELLAGLRGETGPLLIEGETGCGKEIIAKILNAQEPQRNMISVNIASIPENLFESEMFGHVKGAFTGADSLKMGLAEAAHGGDLFLDEIEAMPLTQQVKLLRFLETGEIRRVGAKESIQIKTRVIVASNQKLEKLVREGKFREDLMYRLNGKKIELPPLRERSEDILELAPYFLKFLKPRVNKSFSPEALQAMTKYHWPGNVRELRRVCEQLALTCPLPIIRYEDILKILNPLMSDHLLPDQNGLDFSMGLTHLLENFEALAIRSALKKAKDIDTAAELLQISRSNLYRKLKDYQIEVKG